MTFACLRPPIHYTSVSSFCGVYPRPEIIDTSFAFAIFRHGPFLCRSFSTGRLFRPQYHLGLEPCALFNGFRPVWLSHDCQWRSSTSLRISQQSICTCGSSSLFDSSHVSSLGGKSHGILCESSSIRRISRLDQVRSSCDLLLQYSNSSWLDDMAVLGNYFSDFTWRRTARTIRSLLLFACFIHRVHHRSSDPRRARTGISASWVVLVDLGSGGAICVQFSPSSSDIRYTIPGRGYQVQGPWV